MDLAGRGPGLAVALALALLTSLTAGSAVASRSPIALGLSIPDGRDLAALDAAVGRYGAPPATWTIWSQWGHRNGRAECEPNAGGSCAFPRAMADQLAARGITPMVWWEPVDPSDLEDDRYPRYQNILDGDHDEYIQHWARDARDFGEATGATVILRFAHEVNGRQFPWSVERLDNTPARFRDAWRYVWRLFEAEGALPYVRFMWSVAKRSCPGCNPYLDVYPGDAFVDIVGISAYNWGSERSWKPLEAVLERPVRDLRDVTSRPLYVVEVGSSDSGGDRATWLRDGYAAVYDRWPRIKALVYLDTDQPHREVGHPDWSLGAHDETAVDAYRVLAADPRFGGSARTDPGT